MPALFTPGRTHWGEGDYEIVWGRADPIDLETFEHYGKRYTFLADYQLWQQSPGWWIEEGQEWVAKGLVIDGMRWAYTRDIPLGPAAERFLELLRTELSG